MGICFSRRVRARLWVVKDECMLIIPLVICGCQKRRWDRDARGKQYVVCVILWLRWISWYRGMHFLVSWFLGFLFVWLSKALDTSRTLKADVEKVPPAAHGCTSALQGIENDCPQRLVGRTNDFPCEPMGNTTTSWWAVYSRFICRTTTTLRSWTCGCVARARARGCVRARRACMPVCLHVYVCVCVRIVCLCVCLLARFCT